VEKIDKLEKKALSFYSFRDLNVIWTDRRTWSARLG